MPTGYYSHSPASPPRTFAVTEPDSAWQDARSRVSPSTQAEDQTRPAAVQAKEPDRQNAAHRGRPSSRPRSTMQAYDDDAPSRTRAARGNRRGATQPRRSSQAARRTPSESKTGRPKKSRRGFAAMSPEQQREIARKGGLTVSRNRRHMADIGRVGGEHSHGGRRGRR